MQPEHHHDDEAEEQAWRAIVDNYGDRAEIEETPPPAPPTPPSAPPGPPQSAAPFGGRFGDPSVFHVEQHEPDDEPEDEGYVPPPPPPLPVISPDRGLAWAGVLGSPLVLLGALILGISIPTWLGYLLVMGFVGGFLYLVFQMPREPRDPWDDGAQV